MFKDDITTVSIKLISAQRMLELTYLEVWGRLTNSGALLELRWEEDATGTAFAVQLVDRERITFSGASLPTSDLYARTFATTGTRQCRRIEYS